MTGTDAGKGHAAETVVPGERQCPEVRLRE